MYFFSKVTVILCVVTEQHGLEMHERMDSACGTVYLLQIVTVLKPFFYSKVFCKYNFVLTVSFIAGLSNTCIKRIRIFT